MFPLRSHDVLTFTAMEVWSNFALLVAAQLLVFVFTSILTRGSLPKAVRILWVSCLLGVPFGLVFDLLIGKYHAIFSYNALLHSWTFLLLNGIASYGLAIGTVWQLPATMRSLAVTRFKGLAAFLIILAIVTAALLPVQSIPVAAVVLIVGATILVASEALAILWGKEAPLVALANGRIKPFVVVWIASVLIGLVYERVNQAVGIWIWGEVPPIPHWAYRSVIVALGYFVLLHPMFVITRLVNDAVLGPERR